MSCEDIYEIGSIDLGKFYNNCNDNWKIYNKKYDYLKYLIMKSIEIHNQSQLNYNRGTIEDYLSYCFKEILSSSICINRLLKGNIDFFKEEELFIPTKTIASISRNILEIYRLYLYISGCDINKNARRKKEKLEFRKLLWDCNYYIEHLKKSKNINTVLNKKEDKMECYFEQMKLAEAMNKLIKNLYFQDQYKPNLSEEGKGRMDKIIKTIKEKKFKFSRNDYIEYIDKHELENCYNSSLPKGTYKMLYSIFSNNIHSNIFGKETEKRNYGSGINFLDILILSLETSITCLDNIERRYIECCKISNDENISCDEKNFIDDVQPHRFNC